MDIFVGNVDWSVDNWVEWHKSREKNGKCLVTVSNLATILQKLTPNKATEFNINQAHTTYKYYMHSFVCIFVAQVSYIRQLDKFNIWNSKNVS